MAKFKELICNVRVQLNNFMVTWCPYLSLTEVHILFFSLKCNVQISVSTLFY